jgi:choline dehydrogenase
MFMRFERMHRSKSFEVPTVMKNGIGIIRLLGEEQKKLGVSKPLIVTDTGVVKAGLLEPVTASLKEAGLTCAVYDCVVANPPLDCVAGATEMYLKENCDGLIAVGGGNI